MTLMMALTDINIETFHPQFKQIAQHENSFDLNTKKAILLIINSDKIYMNAKPLISFCRNLPKATKDIKWGKDLVFSVGDKMFAVFDPEDNIKVCFKATPAMFSTLTGKEGIVSAPYIGRFNWVLVEDLEALPTEMLEDLISESYRLVAAKLPAKIRKNLGIKEK